MVKATWFRTWWGCGGGSSYGPRVSWDALELGTPVSLHRLPRSTPVYCTCCLLPSRILPSRIPTSLAPRASPTPAPVHTPLGPPFFCPEMVRGILCAFWVVYAYLSMSSHSPFPSNIVSTSSCYTMTRKQTFGIYFPVDGGLYASVLSCISRVWLCAARWTGTARLLCPWDFPGKNPGVGCHALLQGIFLSQGSYLRLLHCRRILYHWATGEAPAGGLLIPLEVVEVDGCAWTSTL